MKQIAFIDCFTESPANVCVNDFIIRTKIPTTYHMVSQYGFKSLASIPNPDAFIVLGSASHLSDDLPWHKELAIFLDKKLTENIPVLGICFTHQLMANFYGSKVDFIDHSEELIKESRIVEFNQNFLRYSKNQKINLPYCHSQVIKELSDNFITVASSEKFDYEIIKHKTLPFIGMQAHPEASLNFISNEINIETSELITKTKNDGDSFLNYFIASLK